MIDLWLRERHSPMTKREGDSTGIIIEILFQNGPTTAGKLPDLGVLSC